MQIKNKTHWSTRNLKTFVVKICDQEMVTPRYRKYLWIEFNYAKKKGYGYDDYPSGYAWYNSCRMVIHLPKDKIHKRALAKVIAHEMAHNQGVHHKSMHGPRYSFEDSGWTELYAWADELALEKVVPVIPPTPTKLNAAHTKLAGAQAALKAWTTKKKLAMTKVQTYKDRVKYYEARIKEL